MPSSPSPGVAATARTHAYRRRTPERSVLYRLVQSHLATWIGLREEGDAMPAHVERELRRHTPGAAVGARLGAVVFILRFQRSAYGSGALLNAHTHLHVIVLDGLCEPDGAVGVRFQGARGLDDEVVAKVQQRIRTQILRRAHDREGLERLIRYCARPAFAHERLRQFGPDRFRYDAPKPGPKGNVSLIVSPLELLDRLAALIPPPRTHRQRYFGCLAPNAPLRAPIALWAQACSALPQEQALADEHHFTPPAPVGVCVSGISSPAQPSPNPRTSAQWRWAQLLARVFECLPLLCLQCAAPMRIIAFVTDPIPVKAFLSHLNLPTTAPPVSPARGPPPPHDTPRAPTAHNNPHPPWEPNAQPAPDCQFDQRLSR